MGREVVRDHPKFWDRYLPRQARGSGNLLYSAGAAFLEIKASKVCVSGYRRPTSVHTFGANIVFPGKGRSA